MLDKMTRADLLPGMTVTTRDGAIGTVKICSIRLIAHEPIMAIDYTDDLYYGDGDEEHDLDIIRVALPSGAVIWERPSVEIRVFSEALHDEDSKDEGIEWTWQKGLDGKLVSFSPAGSNDGRLDGFKIDRAWTRELTDEERKNWRKEHPRT